MKKRRLILLTLTFTVVSLVAISVVLVNMQDPILTERDHIDRIRSELITQIRDYDQELQTPDSLNQPYSSSGSKKSQSPRSYATELAASDSRYTTVSVVGEMTFEESTENENENSFDQAQASRGIDWLQDPSAIDQIVASAQSAERDWTFAWLQLAHPVSHELVSESLSDWDMTAVGLTGDLVRVKVSNDREKLQSISKLPWVNSIGSLPSERKFNPVLVEQLEDSAPSPLPVFITFVDAKLHTEFRSELDRMGVDTGHFDPSVRAISALIHQDQLASVSKLDFVQAIEPIEVVQLTHDSSIPHMGVDGLRTIGNDNGSFSGITGSSTPVAVMDTGLNTSHVAISELRTSICGRNFLGFEEDDLWFDDHGHGTHVTGTVTGNGFFQPKYAGVAPGAEHIRFAKVLSSFGFGDTLGIIRGMDYLGEETTCAFNGDTPEPVKPLVVNMSLGGTSLTNDSRGIGARKLDSIVWGRKQVYVVANANSNIYGYSNYGASKNSLAVAMAWDSGEIAFISSRGPTIDGRLLPSIAAPGVRIVSTEGGGAWDTYVTSNGTSMASPHVAGVVALLMDASHDHREQPALVRAQLMASAIKPDSWFDSDSMFPSNNTNGPGSIQAEYGMGFVSARTSILNDESENGWTSSGVAVEVEHGDTAYTDIVVPEGASRIDIVMTWDEPATDTIANAVLNDLNLWVDYEADCGMGPCGEYSSRSAIDNVEWIIVRNPDPGVYRVKVDAARVYTESPRVGLAWTIIQGDSSPKLTLEANEQVFETPNGEFHDHDVELTLTADSYVASGTRLHVDCRTLDGGACGTIGFKRRNENTVSRRFGGQVEREDGIELVLQEQPFLVIGEVALGETQNVIVHLSTEIVEPVWVYFTASSFNGDGDSVAVLFRPVGDEEESQSIASPENITFRNALPIIGDRGSYDFDPLLGWTEGGEPTLLTTGLLPARSVWFKWEPDETGLVTFQASPRLRDSELLDEHAPSIDVFQISEGCCGPSASPRVASSVWSAQLFALEGYEYRVRVSHHNASMPLTLSWMRGERPRNDNFANAISLSGESGEVSGSNLGATLEPGELYGQLASTVWYEWTAPDDGSWQFQIPDTLLVHVLAFVGDSVEDLRLVSGVSRPGEPIQFPAKQGATYNIMVASPSAYSGGWEFDELSWEKLESSNTSNDMFEFARTLSSQQQGGQYVSTGSGSNVEPDEPSESGIQTRWWRWRAPATGTFTWYWNEETLDVAVFSGDSFMQLEPSMRNGGISGPMEFAMDATQDEDYWISIGRKQHETLAYIPAIGSGTSLNWGNTPENNTLDGAIALSGPRGSEQGSVQYATTESDGLSGLGRSSLWYSYEVEESGWIRFYLDGSSFQPTRISAFNQ
ncbi:MAG: S8 family serine peptidase, partial [Gammaproteobacteria bacterium]|nr:S8 family serine peptidase [Gammaproteobacteria bacterium]